VLSCRPLDQIQAYFWEGGFFRRAETARQSHLAGGADFSLDHCRMFKHSSSAVQLGGPFL
jgi:hypothetical protein